MPAGGYSPPRGLDSPRPAAGSSRTSARSRGGGPGCARARIASRRFAPQPTCAAGAMAWPSALLTLLLTSTLLLPLLARSYGRGSARGSLLDEYAYYERVVPVLRRAGADLRPNATGSFRLPPDLTLSLAAFNETFDLELAVSASLYADDLKARRLRGNGTAPASVRLPPTDCYYSGHASGCSACVAAFNLCREVTGFFTLGGETYLVEGVGEPPQVSRYIFRASDARGRRNRRRSLRDTSRPARSGGFSPARSSAEWTPVRVPAGSNRDTRFIELYLVMDRALYRKYRDETEARGIEIVNYASALLRPLNVYIVLVGVEVWQSSDRISISRDPGATLANFLYHRQYYINPSVPNDNAQLLLGAAEFADGVLGKAEIGGMCTRTRSGGIAADGRESSLAAATTMAHELGHNLGLLHDESYGMTADDAPFSDPDPDRRCPCSDRSGKCIMSGLLASGGLPTTWSECSKAHLSELFNGGGADACLGNVPNTLPGNMNRCGNYLVEQGEECDCGPLGTCDNRCCDAATCRLKVGAVCGAGECCDLATCSYALAGQMCRGATGGDEGGCDFAEYCNGTSQNCPDDVHLHDGAPCSNSGGSSYCYQGLCRTRGSQCRKLWGDSGRDAQPVCYATFNRLGSAQGHCGYDALYNIYSRCEPANAACGLLQCEERAEKLAYWQAALLGDSVKTAPSVDGGVAYCHSVTMDASPGIANPAMVPDGAPCGNTGGGHVCVAARCVALAGAATYAECTASCSGRGRCNSLKHCHCDVPYAPPFCQEAGLGGSVDSGPASSVAGAGGAGQAVSVPLIVVFVCCVPLAGIAAAFAYYYRGWLRQSSRDLRRRRSECCRCLSFRYRNVSAGGAGVVAAAGSTGGSGSAAADVVIKGSAKPARPSGPAAAPKRLSVEISTPVLESTTNGRLDWDGGGRRQPTAAAAAAPVPTTPADDALALSQGTTFAGSNGHDRRWQQQPTVTGGKRRSAEEQSRASDRNQQPSAAAAAAVAGTDVDEDCLATRPLLPAANEGSAAKNSRRPVQRQQQPTAGRSPLLPPALQTKAAAAAAAAGESSEGSEVDADGVACSTNVKPSLRLNADVSAASAASKTAGDRVPAAAAEAAAVATTPTPVRHGSPAAALRPQIATVQQQLQHLTPAAASDARQKQLAAGAAAKVTGSPGLANKAVQPPLTAASASASKTPTPVVAKKPLAPAISVPVPSAAAALPSALKRVPSLNAGKTPPATAAAVVATGSRTPTAVHKAAVVTRGNDPSSGRAPASPSAAAAHSAVAAAAASAAEPLPCSTGGSQGAARGGAGRGAASGSPKPLSPKAAAGAAASAAAAVTPAVPAQSAAASRATGPAANNSSANNSPGLRAHPGSPRVTAASGRQQPVYENLRPGAAATAAAGTRAVEDSLYDDVLVTPRDKNPRV